MSVLIRRAVGIGVLFLSPVLAGCTGVDDSSAPSPAPATTATTTATATPPPTAEAAPTPEPDVCYDLGYDEAVSPTAEAEPVPCGGTHTAETIDVGPLDNVADGHLLAVDSEQVQDAVATACPQRFAEVVGGSPDDQRLSMLRPLWFTPTLEQSSLGASWFRCDVVALDGAEQLAEVTGSLAGVLDGEAGREQWGMCGTAGPDDATFERVPCGREHSWRAFDVVDLPDGGYPGAEAIRDAAEGPCEDAAAALAEDPLDYEWGFEGPDAAQWDLGQTFARCWAPD